MRRSVGHPVYLPYVWGLVASIHLHTDMYRQTLWVKIRRQSIQVVYRFLHFSTQHIWIWSWNQERLVHTSIKLEISYGYNKG